MTKSIVLNVSTSVLMIILKYVNIEQKGMYIPSSSLYHNYCYMDV